MEIICKVKGMFKDKEKDKDKERGKDKEEIIISMDIVTIIKHKE